MSIDEIMEKTVIKLPEELSLSESEKLLAYIAGQLPGDVNYQTTYFRSILHSVHTDSTPEKMSTHEGTSSIVGTFVSHKTPGVYGSFRFGSSREGTSKLDAIRFELVPGWDLHDYSTEVIRLWDDVREKTMQYFKLS